MELHDINNVLRDQMNSLNHLTPPLAFASTIQTIRMGLYMLKSSFKLRYDQDEYDQIDSIIHMIDRNLYFLMKDNDDKPEDSDEESPNETSEVTECDNCRKKEKKIECRQKI